MVFCEESELFVRTYLRARGLGLTNIFQTTQQKDKLGRGGCRKKTVA